MSEIQVQPGSDLQALVTANPAGTVFRLTSGVHRGQSVTIPGKNDLTFVGGPGVVLQGDGKPFAFSGKTGQQTGDRIIIRGLEITGYSPPRQQAVIQGYGEAFDWLIEDCDIHDNANVGIGMSRGWTVRNCRVHHQGTLGLGGSGTLVEDTEIDNNNTSHVDPGWEGGGTKFTYTDSVTVRRCNVHDNWGMGLWTDGNIRGILFEDNTIMDNLGPGVDIEISHQAVVRRNRVVRCGAGGTGLDAVGILISTSDDVLVEGNEIADCAGGVGLKNADRSSSVGGPYVLRNVTVRGNLVCLPRGLHGWYDTPGTASGIVFENNRYEVDPARQGFRVNGATMAWPAWQARWQGEQLADDEQQEESGMSNFGAVAGLTVVGVKGPAAKPGKPVLQAGYMLGWDAVASATSYRVQKRLADGSWILVEDTDSLAVTVPGRGRYRVRALNSAGAGPWASLLV